MQDAAAIYLDGFKQESGCNPVADAGLNDQLKAV